MIFLLLSSGFLAYFTWSVICLEINVRKARAMGVPSIRVPIDFLNMPWMTLQPLVWSITDRLPIPWSSYPDCVRFSRRGWHFADKSHTHVRLGPVFALVTPGAVYLHFVDAEAISDMFSRREDFVRPIKEYKLLEVYGPCLSTAGWDDWPRHRKPLAAPFNERIMPFVWNESLNQAQAMLSSWTGSKAILDGVPSVQQDTRTLSLNVLAAVGFGDSFDYHGSTDPHTDTAGEELSYRDALKVLLDNVVLLMVVPVPWLTAPMMPKSWAKLGKAFVAFKGHMKQMVSLEITNVGSGKTSSRGIMTAFVHALDENRGHEKSKQAAAPSNDAVQKNIKRGLTIDEVYSNLFIINFAGHDTTANTLAFTMFLLAGNPDIQAWLYEEIIAVVGDTAVEDWDYKTLFPRLTRCRAILHETIRIFPPVMALPKWTSRNPQTLNVRGKTLSIPQGTNTTLFLLAVQTHPKYWEDPHTWKPSRWIVSGAGPVPQDDNTGGSPFGETLFVPRKGTYFPWSDGPQNCPGKKFSEVEAVAVLACLFREHRLRVFKSDAGESDEVACRRAMACTQSVDMHLLLRMADKDEARLICTKM